LFRQTKYGQWDDVFEKIEDALKERVKLKEAA
jgi:hypothetical protein